MTLSFAPERIEPWPLERLKPYARNAKTHGADQVAKIAGSMAQFGWTVPVLVAGDGEVIAGHGRILAATQLGLTEAPVIVLDHLTEAQRRAYRIADNKLTELGAWDEALLAGELQELLAEDFDLSVVGFSDAELDAAARRRRRRGRHARRRGRGPGDAGRPGQPAGRSLAARPAPAALRRRDGDHRPRPADGRAEGRPLLHRQPLQRRLRRRRRRGEGRQGPAHPERRARRRLRALPLRRLRLDHHAHRRRDLHVHVVERAAHAAEGLRRRRRALVDLHHLGEGSVHARALRLPAAVRADPLRLAGGAKHHWCGARDQGDVWFIDRPSRNDLHPTMKPVGLVERAIRNSSPRGGLVLDPFGGSGTTLIAAERTGRVAHLIELDPKYCDVIVQRWQNETGRAARLDGGEAFDQLASGRREAGHVADAAI